MDACMVLFFKMQFLVSFEESPLQRCKFKILVETVKPFGYMKLICILQLPISYCVSLVMVTITRHIFINIFQMEHFFNSEICHGVTRKKMSFLVISKSPKVWKKVEKIRLGSFKVFFFFFFKFIFKGLSDTANLFYMFVCLHASFDTIVHNYHLKFLWGMKHG